MACDIVQTSGVRTLIQATPEQFEQTIREYEAVSPDNSADEEIGRPSLQQYNLAKKYRAYSIYQLRKESMTLAGKALDLVNRGNQKQVFDPRVQVTEETYFPEYAEMRALARLAVAGAYVAFAEGRSKQGTQYLCDAIILGQNLADNILISRLVGISIQAIAFASFENHLPSMSLVDAQMVEALAPKLIISPPASAKSIQREFEFLERNLSSMFNDPTKDYLGLDVTTAEKSFSDLFLRLTPTQKQEVFQICKRNLTRQREAILAIFRKPESEWDEVPDDLVEEFDESRTVNNITDISLYILATVSPLFSQVSSAEIRNRTQIRLLALAGSVIQFSWENDRWPSKLTEAASEKAVFDPANNGEFQYELLGTGFRVYSKGSKTTGEIGLRYRRQQTEDNTPAPP